MSEGTPTILITGGTGFIGSRTLKALADGGCSCTATCRATSQKPDVPGVTWVEANLGSREAAEALQALEDVDVVVHLASADPRNGSWSESAMTNVAGTAQILDAAAAAGASRFVYVSTSDVYIPATDLTVELGETAPRVEAPAHAYPLTKRQAEELVTANAARFDEVTILRPAAVYGPGQDDESYLAELGDSLRMGEQVTLAGEHGHRLSPTWVDDVVAVLVKAATDGLPGVFNVAGNTMWEQDVAGQLGDFLHEPVAIIETENRPVSVALSTSALDAAWPDRPNTSWADGMAKTWS